MVQRCIMNGQAKFKENDFPMAYKQGNISTKQI